MRKYKRFLAKSRMERRGMRKLCKHGKGQKSFFSSNWREYLNSEKVKVA